MGARCLPVLLAVMAACGPDDPLDCDDADPDIGSDQPEICDGVDNDCDGVVDEPDAVDAVTWYADGDGDGYGREDATERACSQPNGYASQAGDCDDGDPAVNPGGVETCDGLDQDCDGLLDEDPDLTWYADADGDGWGDEGAAVAACNAPTGSVADPGDCDDGDPAVHPGAVERCNGMDDDCDGEADESEDLDGDGFQAPCNDCDDTDPYVHPGAEEICGHSLDDDCDGYPMDCGIAGNLLASEADGVIRGSTWGLSTSGSAAVGDVDGDGEAELIVGNPANFARDGVGHLFLDPVFGEHGQEEAAVHLVRPAYGDLSTNLQGAVVTLGDLDGDGLDDVLTGDAGSYGWSGGGAVLVFYSPLLGEEDISLADACIQTTEEDDAFSDSLVVGDLNGDGVGDVVVGAPGLYGHAIDGGVYVFAGPPSGALTLSDAAVTLRGESGSQAGSSAVGDVDGDGFDDLLVGAPSCAYGGGAPPGAAYILFGPVTGDLDLADAPVRLLGTMTYADIGARADLGDLDGDGLSDLLLQTCGASCGVEIFSGRSDVGTWEGASSIAMLLGDSDHSFGYQNTVADLDADGQGDLLSTAFLSGPHDPSCCGNHAAYVFSGPVEGALEASEAVARTDDEYVSTGDALAAADLNGDGADDLVWTWWFVNFHSYYGFIQTDIFYGGAP